MAILANIDRAVDAIAVTLGGASTRRPLRILVYVALVLVIFWFPYAIVWHVYTSGFHLVSVARENRVGEMASEQLEKRMDLLPAGRPVALYISDIGSQIALQHNPWEADFKFHVIDDENMVNAFAVPGGKIYITTAMLRKLDNEAELAAVLGHEVAHVAERHYARKLGREMLMSWVKKFLGGTDRTMLEAGSYLTARIAMVQMSQEDEIEADYNGTLYIYELGYDPTASVSLTKKLLALEKKMPDIVKVFALTHPPSRERVDAMVQLNQTLPGKEGVSLGTEQYKAKMRSLPSSGGATTQTVPTVQR
jgi:predicted Zn-dependent protease